MIRVMRRTGDKTASEPMFTKYTWALLLGLNESHSLLYEAEISIKPQGFVAR